MVQMREMKATEPSSAFNRFFLPTLQRPTTYIVMGVAILLLDWATGEFISFPILFVIPVILAAWFCGGRIAYTLSFLLPLGRFFIATFAEDLIPVPFTIINSFIRVAVLSFIAFLGSRARAVQSLKRQVKLMEDILPVCMHCKRIRDKLNNWEEIEVYVARQTEAAVSHGICPECAKEIYGNVLDHNSSAY